MFFSKRAPKQKGGCLDTLDTPGSATDWRDILGHSALLQDVQIKSKLEIVSNVESLQNRKHAYRLLSHDQIKHIEADPHLTLSLRAKFRSG